MKKIVLTGYGWSGSGAVFDLLKEYENCSINQRYLGNHEDREHILLHMPNGLFDLEKTLLSPHDIHSADEALFLFHREMEKLQNIRGTWYGEYGLYFGNQFSEIVERFLRKLNIIPVDVTGYNQSSLGKTAVLSIIKQGLLNPRSIKENLERKKILIRGDKKLYAAYPSDKEFFEAGREFICDYVNMIYPEEEYGTQNVIFDHLCLPCNAEKLLQYVREDNFRIIIVDRDVRDIYCFIKTSDALHPYPKELDAFIEYYRGMHKYDQFYSDEIMRVQFEELVENYDETVKKIEEFLELQSEKHVNTYKFFDPRISKKNIRLYERNRELENDVKEIEKKLPEFCVH